MTQHPAANVVATGLPISAMAILNACYLGPDLPLICSVNVELKAHQSRLLRSGQMALHFNSSLMTTEMSFRILDLAVQTRQIQALQNAADTLRQLRQNNLTPLYSVRSALSLSVVVVSSTSMSKLTIGTSNAKNLAALLVAFIEFKISTVTLRLGTALGAEVESTARFQDVPRPPRGFHDEIITSATVDSDTPLAKNAAQSSIPSLSFQADWASPYFGSEISCEEASYESHRRRRIPIEEFNYNPSQSFPSLCNSCSEFYAMGSRARMIWTDECFRKAPYIIVYPRYPLLSKLAKMFSFNGVYRRGLRIKDWQNAHGKVGRWKMR